MLPSRGLSRSNPASALRLAGSVRTQSIRPSQVPLRYFSQAQSRSTLLNRSRTASSTPISLIGSRPVLAATTSSIFTQNSGASRNLSLWPFSSKPKSPAETEFKSSAEAQPTSATFSEPFEPDAPLEASAQEPLTQDDLASAQDQLDSPADLGLPSILDMPEQIGYLKSIGLDFGWGPTAMCEWAVEHIYIYTGMPWWAVLTTMAFAWRAALFVPTLKGSKHQAMLQKLTRDPAYIQAKEEFDEAVYKSRDMVAQKKARDKLMALKKASGASTIGSLATLWSFPFSWGMFRLLRNMSAIPVPSLETGGMLWFTDFTIHDPYFILPFTSVTITTLMIKQTQAATQGAQLNPQAALIQKGMLYGMPPVMFLATAWLPAGLQWFFLMFSAAAVVQSSATLNPAIRRWVGMPTLASLHPKTAPSANEAGATYTSPSSGRSGFIDSMMNSPTKQKWKKAKEYEERRSAEEDEEAERRMDEIRRKRAERQRS